MWLRSLLWLSALVTSALTIAIAPTSSNMDVPNCALIVKLVNSAGHEFQIVLVDCPVPRDYCLECSPDGPL